MEIKKKILVFTDWYEPGFKAGGPIRSCVNFAAHMKEDYDIYIFTGDKDLGDARAYSDIETNQWLKQENVNIYYASSGALNWENILVQVKKIKPLYIYLNSMFSRYFTIYPLLMQWIGFIKSRVVLAPRGMLKSTAVQYKSGKKQLFFKFMRLLGLHNNLEFHATDTKEVADIKKLFGGNVSIYEVSNFPPMQKTLKPINKERGVARIIFVGRVHPIKNLYFLLHCLQTIRGKLVLTIVATIEDKAYWLQCTEFIKNLPEHITVSLHKDIPHHQIEQFINEHHAFALPTLGENFGHAIFESLAAGRPVLISDQTPWKHLQQSHAGWDLPLSDETAFVQVLQQLVDMDDARFQKWSVGAWQYARDFTEGADLKRKYLELFS